MKKFLILISLFSSFHLSMAQSSILDDFLSSETIVPASVGLLIRNMETGEVVASHDPMVCRNPASVTKVVTTATAMEILTDTFRFKTRIELSGNVEDSVLYGNLYIRGGGDPTLESAYSTQGKFVKAVVDTIKGLGIKKIAGSIVGDATYFREDGAPFNWLVEDVGSSYSPTPSSLSVYDNMLNFVLTSDSNGISMSKLTPETNLFYPVIEMSQIPDKQAGWRFTKPDFSWTPIIRGNLPLGVCQYMKTEIPEPAMMVADIIRKKLTSNGVEVEYGATTTRWMNADADSLRREIFCYQSAILKDIERITNYKSINLFAENIFLTIPHAKDEKTPSTTWSAASTIAKFWKEKGIRSDRIFQVDGSGMSMKNAISPQFIVDVLTYMHRNSRYSSSFYNTLPTAGRNGTVTSFLKGTKLEGQARIKSGSMERVQNYAGYINANGKWYAFCIMVSNFSGQRKPVVKQIASLLNDLIAEDGKLIKNK